MHRATPKAKRQRGQRPLPEKGNKKSSDTKGDKRETAGTHQKPGETPKVLRLQHLQMAVQQRNQSLKCQGAEVSPFQ